MIQFTHCVAFVCTLIFLNMRLHIRVFSDLCGNKECVTKGKNQAVTTRNQKLQTKSAGKFSLFLTTIHYALHFSVVWGLVLRISNQKFASSDVVTIYFFLFCIFGSNLQLNNTQRISLLLFHYNNGYTKAQQCYIIRILPIL